MDSLRLLLLLLLLLLCRYDCLVSSEYWQASFNRFCVAMRCYAL
jgi:hypothetical protein